MNADEIKRRFPNASSAFVRANLSIEDTGTPSKLESDFRDATLGAEEIQKPTGARTLVCVTSIRKRLLDEDNLCEKYHVDLLRYAGILPSDAPDKIQIKVCQRKAAKGEEEHTVIEIWK